MPTRRRVDIVTGIAIREARQADAQGLLDYLRELTSEPDVPILTTHERALGYTLAFESDFIRQHRDQPNSLMLLAFAEEQIIGSLVLTGGDRAETAHSVSLGMSVAKAWRDRGIGHALIDDALEWARRTRSVSRVELEVFPDNARAIHLYEMMGFELEGRRRRAYIKDGVTLDALVMGLLL